MVLGGAKYTRGMFQICENGKGAFKMTEEAVLFRGFDEASFLGASDDDHVTVPCGVDGQRVFHSELSC